VSRGPFVRRVVTSLLVLSAAGAAIFAWRV
jgi:hypothetical protein